MFTTRLVKPELLDHAAPEEARANLDELVKINQRFGGHSVIKKVLTETVRTNDQFTLLDIGAGSGDTARLIHALYPRAVVTSLDYRAVHIETAPKPKLVADAFALPFLPDSFDYVMCNLFLHHFNDDQVVTMLRTFYSIAHTALLVCDLERRLLPYLFLPATRPLFGWKRITLHDGPISVRASFRSAELRELSTRAGIADACIKTHRPAFRISLSARKRQ